MNRYGRARTNAAGNLLRTSSGRILIGSRRGGRSGRSGRGGAGGSGG